MQFKRMFTTDAYKGTRGYLRTQKTYEILRTVLYFAISLSLFIAGWVSTGSLSGAAHYLHHPALYLVYGSGTDL